MGSPRPPPPAGLYLRAGAAGLEGITRLSHGEVCPSSGDGTPPHPARAGGSPQSAFVPALERMDWRQPGSAVSRRHQRPRGSGRGKGDRWRDGGTDGQSRCRDRRLWRDPLLCQPGGCGTGSTGWGSAHAAHTVPALGMCQSAPEMLPQPLGHSGWSWLLGGATKPWEQCDRAPAVLAQTSWHCLQGMGSWKSRSYSGSPSLKKPPQGAGRGGCGIRQPRLIPACGIPALLSCLTPSSLREGHKPREREASRAHGRCPTLWAQPRVWAKTGHPFEGTLVMSDAAAGATTSSLSPCPHSLTRGNFLARHNSSEKFMAH